MSNTPLPEPVAWGTLGLTRDADRSLFTNKTAAEDFHERAYELTPLHTADQMHTHAAAVTAAKDAEIAGLRDVLQFIAGHNLDGADDRARAIICGLFIIKAKKALAARAALGDKT